MGGISAEVGAVCKTAADRLAADPDLCPSVWLERGGLLRCVAGSGDRPARDGISPTAGVLGATFMAGTEPVVSHAWAGRAPGGAPASGAGGAPPTTTRACLPIRCDGCVVGVLDVRFTRPIARSELERLRNAADDLGRDIAGLGGPPAESGAQRILRQITRVSALDDPDAIAGAALAAAIELLGLDSAALARPTGASATHRGSPGLAPDGGADRSAGATRVDPVADGADPAGRHTMATLGPLGPILARTAPATLEAIAAATAREAAALAAEAAAVAAGTGTAAAAKAAAAVTAAASPTAPDGVVGVRLGRPGAVAAVLLGRAAATAHLDLEPLCSAGVETLVAVGLVAHGQSHGVLLLADQAEKAIATEDVELLELLAAHAAACLRTADLVLSLRERAATDPLTGLGHHATFHEALARTHRRPRTAVVLVDVDGFKRLNDTFGHQHGDHVLRAIAAALSSALRRGDTLFRIGGDEFAALLAVSDDPDEPLDAGLRLRAAVAAAQLGVTVSIGVAVPREGEPDGALLDRADRALYRVKAAGRDGVAVADAEPRSPRPPV